MFLNRFLACLYTEQKQVHGRLLVNSFFVSTAVLDTAILLCLRHWQYNIRGRCLVWCRTAQSAKMSKQRPKAPGSKSVLSSSLFPYKLRLFAMDLGKGLIESSVNTCRCSRCPSLQCQNVVTIKVPRDALHPRLRVGGLGRII